MAFFGSLFNLFKKTEFNDEVANQLFFGIVKAGFKTLPEAVRAEYAPENRSKSTKIGQARETALKVLDAGLKVMATENREYYKIYHAFEEKYTKIIEQFYLKNQIKDPTVAEQILADAVIRLVHSILIGEYKEKRVDKEDIEHKEKGSKFNTYFQEKCRSAVTSWRNRYKLYQSKYADTPEEFLGFKNRYGTEISLDEESKKISSLGINPDKDMTEEETDTELDHILLDLKLNTNQQRVIDASRAYQKLNDEEKKVYSKSSDQYAVCVTGLTLANVKKQKSLAKKKIVPQIKNMFLLSMFLWLVVIKQFL